MPDKMQYDSFNNDDSIHHSKLSVDFKPRQPLPDSDLSEILGKLRPEGSLPVIIQMPSAGTDLIPILRQQLLRLGYDVDDKYFKRFVDASSMPEILERGTDRNKKSEIDHKYRIGDTGDSLAMVENGLDPQYDRDLVTYVSDLSLGEENVFVLPNNTSRYAILIYSSHGMRYIRPSTYPFKTSYNGLAMFEDRRLIQPSLLAVVLSEEQR